MADNKPVTGKVFAEDVDSSVQGTLNTRKAYYGAQLRDSGAHAWLLQKTAYAFAAAKTVNGKSSSLTVPTQGGFGANGMYTNTGTQRFTPKSHITAVKISNEGKWGSTKRAELSFTTYSLSGLDSLSAFFTVGADVTIEAGWNSAGGAAGKPMRFSGIVYNFSYNLNANGGFDCTCEAISESVLAASLRVAGQFETGATPPPPPPESTEPGQESPANNIFSLFKDEVTRVSADGSVSEIEPETALPLKGEQLDLIAVAFKLKRTPEGQEEADGDADEGEEPAEPIYYVTLEQVVDQINKMIGSKVKFKYICNETTTISEVNANMRSANPLVLIIPGRMNYSDDFNITNTGHEQAIENGDISKLLISIDWLLKTAEEYQKSIGNTTPKDAGQIDAFFEKIFEMIKTYTGSYHLLGIITDPKIIKPTEWSIIDTNYINSNPAPYSFEAGTKRSMVRSISMNTKIPSKFAAAAYISARQANTSATADVYVSDNLAGQIKADTVFNPETDLVPITKDLIKDISDANIQKMSAALSKLKSAQPSTAPPNKLQPAAIDLSVTVDGIEGIVFGNTITTNYIPSDYASSVYFTVTNVEHNISNNDWTTTLSTVMRMK
jgi:hypothetical protein